MCFSSSRQFDSSSCDRSSCDIKIPPIKDENFETIIHKKLKICNQIYSFSDSSVSEEREQKTKVLEEILRMFDIYSDLSEISINMQYEIFRMLTKNILDQTPKYPDIVTSCFYTVHVIDPMWPHLSFAFNILEKFINLFPYSKCFTDDVIKKNNLFNESP